MNTYCTPGEEVRDLSEVLEPESGAKGGSDQGTRRGAGEGERPAPKGGGEEGAAGAVLAVPAYTYPPPLPFTGADRVPSPARSFPSPHLTNRETETPGKRENVKPRAQGHRTGKPATHSGTRRPWGPRHHPRAQRPGLRPRSRTGPRDRKSGGPRPGT